MAQLELRSITVGFPGAGAPVLRDLSLSLSSGELVVALGPSGCGKTTLLNVAAGFTAPDAGEVFLDGVPVRGPDRRRAVVFQRDALYPWLNARDNVAFALKLRGLSREERRARADEALELVGLRDAGHRQIWQLSGGMRQRVGIARALVADPDFLLMDEPFGALDELTRERMQELLLTVWSRSGKGILLITHSVEEAVFLATRLIVMTTHGGRFDRQTTLGFGTRFAAGTPSRAIKAAPDFVAEREHVLGGILDQVA